MKREHVAEVAEGVLDFFTVDGTAVASDNSVTATLKGDVDADADEAEQQSGCELWGSGALLERPAAATAEGGPEVIAIRRGDELVGIATRDRRWQVTLEAGEVVVRAYGSGAAVLRLKPNGDAVLGDQVYLGGPTASDFVALASLVNAKFDKLYDAITAAAVSAGDGGAAFKTNLLVALDAGDDFTPSDVGATKVRAL